MKLLLKIVKKIIISSLLIYSYNYIASSFNMIIPINYLTITVVSFLGSFGLLGLVIFRYLFL